MKSLHLLDKVDTTLNPPQISGGCIIQQAEKISWVESSTNEMWARRCFCLSLRFFAKNAVNTELAAGLVRTKGNATGDARRDNTDGCVRNGAEAKERANPRWRRARMEHRKKKRGEILQKVG